MRTMTFVPVLAVALVAGSGRAAAQDPKAEAVLTAARQALGGADRLDGIKTVTAKGKHRRSMGDVQASGETEIDVTFPDKYLRSQTDQIFGNSITVESGFEGDQPVQRSNSVGGGPNVVFRMGGPGMPGGAGADPAAIKAAQLRAQRADFARLTLGWFATAPRFLAPTYSYVGEAESPDGRADVIEVKGQDNFAARLFVDQQTHRPLMLTYMGVQPMMRVVRRPGPAQESPAQPRGEGDSKRPEDVVRETAHEPRPLVEVQVYFDDYRKVGDLWLPHRISRSVNGQTAEEIDFDKIQVK